MATLNFERQKASLSGDIDRLFAQVKQELDTRSQAHQTKLDEFRNEIHSEVATKVVGVDEECTELKRRLVEEREKRGKLEKHIGGLMRWQEEAKYIMEDLRRKIDDVEESRSTDKRDLRKELSKREDQTAMVQADMRKDLDYLRSIVVGKGSSKEGGAGEPSMRTIEQSLAAMHERCDKTEQVSLVVSTRARIRCLCHTYFCIIPTATRLFAACRVNEARHFRSTRYATTRPLPRSAESSQGG